MEESPFKGRTGLARLGNALIYSLHGFASAFKHEDAFCMELLLAAVLIPLAFMFDVPAMSRAIMIASVLLMLIVELLNSALESVVDRVSIEKHPLSKRAKDMGSAAVLLSLFNAAVVWGFALIY